MPDTHTPEPSHRASCHCGRVRVDVFAPLPAEVYDCNCSICTKKGYLHWFVPRHLVRVNAADEALVTYTFNTGRAKHHFCSVCGAAPFYVARSHPDSLDINVRCVEEADLSTLTILPFDGRNWEAAIEQLRGQAPDARDRVVPWPDQPLASRWRPKRSRMACQP